MSAWPIFFGFDPLKLQYTTGHPEPDDSLPMVPLIYYTSKRRFMGEFVNRKATTIAALICAVMTITLNTYLLSSLA